eukprot:4084586-Pyramimonas_sp.AAC.1
MANCEPMCHGTGVVHQQGDQWAAGRNAICHLLGTCDLLYSKMSKTDLFKLARGARALRQVHGRPDFSEQLPVRLQREGGVERAL